MGDSGPVDGLIWVALRWGATCGLVVAAGRVVDAPPVLRKRAKGRDARVVWRDLARQADQLVWLPDPQPAEETR